MHTPRGCGLLPRLNTKPSSYWKKYLLKSATLILPLTRLISNSKPSHAKREQNRLRRPYLKAIKTSRFTTATATDFRIFGVSALNCKLLLLKIRNTPQLSMGLASPQKTRSPKSFTHINQQVMEHRTNSR